MKKNLGFTLLEVLVVVVILGIISGVAVAGYSTYIRKARNNYYKVQEDMLTQAGKDFFTDNRGKLPQATREESCVLLSTLVSNKYIDKVLDYNKKACSETGSKVCARKLSTSKYLYYSYLDCGNAYTTVEYEKPTLSFSLAKNSTVQNEDNDDYPLTMTISDEANSSKNNAGIASYRYVIYRKDKNDLVYYDSMWKSYKDQTKMERTLTINLDSSGTYYVRGWAYNRGGKLVTGISGEVTLNYTLDCQNQIEFDAPNYVAGTWSKENIDVNVSKKGAVESFDIILNNNSTNDTTLFHQYQAKTYKASVKKEGINKLKIICHDFNGNTDTATSPDYKIDKTKPTCSISGSNTIASWTNNTVSLKATCTDTQGSGCVQNIVTKTITQESNSNQILMNVYDKAGNEGKCYGSAYIDKTKPTLTVKGYLTKKDSNGNYIYINSSGEKVDSAHKVEYKEGTWTKYYVKLEATGKDLASGINTSSYYYNIKYNSATSKGDSAYQNTSNSIWINKSIRQVNATGNSDVRFKVSDNANNTSTSNWFNIKIDNKAPLINYNIDNNNTSKDITITITGSDTESGLARYDDSYCQYYIKEGSATKGQGQGAWHNCGSGTNKNQYIVKATGISIIKFKIRDKVGNEKETDWLTVVKKSPQKTFSDIVISEKVGKYATLNNGTNGTNSSAIAYNQDMIVSSKTKYDNCWNCNTSSWINGWKYVRGDFSILEGSNNKKIKISINLSNNVGTGIYNGSGDEYVRKICFTTGRNYSTAKCYGNDITIKKSSDNWNDKAKIVTAELDVPQEPGSYAIKIFSPDCYTGCNPSSGEGGKNQSYNCDGYFCGGIISFQTDFIITVK